MIGSRSTMPTPKPNNPNRFEPPTAEQLAGHLDKNPPMLTGGWQSHVPKFVLIGLGLLMVLALLQPGLMLLPLLALVGAMFYLSNRTRAAQALQQRAKRAWELAMIRRYRDALGEAWRLLPACRDNPELHGRTVTIIAHVLSELRCEEAAEVAYTYLLDRLPSDHPLSMRLQLQRVIIALSSGRLADADDTLRRMRGTSEMKDDPALSGAYTLARLLQDVRTGHFAEAIEQADESAKALKPLGVEAGYGHGLIAYCYHQVNLRSTSETPEQQQANTSQAKKWWNQATILIPPAALVFRFPELGVLDEIQGDSA